MNMVVLKNYKIKEQNGMYYMFRQAFRDARSAVER